MELFDTHAHLLDERFDKDREELIASLPQKGVQLVMEACISTDYLKKITPLSTAIP